jgi:predicted nucleic acid-binding protein
VGSRPGRSPLITVDTSAIFSLLDRQDPQHDAVRRALAWDRGPYLVPVAILAEIGYVVERRLGDRALDAFLADVEEARYELDCGENDVSRVRELAKRYADLPLGLADASVVACAERNGRRVLTVDRRHFDVVGSDVGLNVLPS